MFAEVLLLQAGAITGMLHFLTQDACYGTLKALEATEVRVLSSEAFHSLLHDPQNRRLAEGYIAFLSKQLRRHSKSLNKVLSTLREQRSTALRIAFFDTKSYMQKAFEQVSHSCVSY